MEELAGNKIRGAISKGVWQKAQLCLVVIAYMVGAWAQPDHHQLCQQPLNKISSLLLHTGTSLYQMGIVCVYKFSLKLST